VVFSGEFPFFQNSKMMVKQFNNHRIQFASCKTKVCARMFNFLFSSFFPSISSPTTFCRLKHGEIWAAALSSWLWSSFLQEFFPSYPPSRRNEYLVDFSICLRSVVNPVLQANLCIVQLWLGGAFSLIPSILHILMSISPSTKHSKNTARNLLGRLRYGFIQ